MFIGQIRSIDLILRKHKRYLFCLDSLKNKVIWITGASTGIGASCAIEAAKHGAKVVISARSKDQLDDVKLKCLGNYISNHIWSGMPK